MTISSDIQSLFGCITSDSQSQDDVVPLYLEEKYKLIGVIENIREKDECDLYEIAGLLNCIVNSDEEEVRETALRVICEKSNNQEVKKIAMIVSSFDKDDDVITTMLEEANDFDLTFAKEMASRFADHPDISVSTYANGILKR